MVRAILDIDEADYERLRKAADERGMTVESFIVAQAVNNAPTNPAASAPTQQEAIAPDPAARLLYWFERADREGWKSDGPYLTDDEMYTR